MWFALALLAAVSWGTADFLGGLAARKAAALKVLLIGLPAGMALLLPFLIAQNSAPTPSLMAWGAASGLASGLGTALLYSALGMGPMNVVAPLSATSSAVVPIVVGLLLGERPGAGAALGMILAGIAVVLISREPPESSEPSPIATRRAVLTALGAGALIGTAMVFLDQVADQGSLWPVAASRASAWSIVLIIAVVGGAAGVPPRSVIPFAIGAGILDTTAQVASLRALQDGLLSVVAVIVALYPGATVLLARVFLRERLHAAQLAGLGLAGAAIVLMALQ